MTYRLHKSALLLAALLQLLPVVRTVCMSPAAGSAFAFILRWGIGTGVVLGSVDAVSGATSVFTTPATISGAVGTAMSNNVTVSIGGGNNASSSDYLIVSSGSTTSPLLYSGQSTAVTLPAGLSFTASWVNGATTIGGYFSGTPTAAGTYATSVTIVSPGNASLSQNITIIITGTTTPTAPAITASPVAANVAAGKNATFNVTASGTAPLGYFWLKNGTALANAGNISGANTATLTLTNVSATDAANYSVLVSNSLGTATSTAVALTVILPPVISAQPAAQAAASGGNASYSVTATGTAPLAYKWLKNGGAITNGTKYSGVASNVLNIVAVTTNDVANYSVIITNAAGSITSAIAPLTIVATPTITTPPANLSVAAGAGASFTVSAAGSAPLFYFWLKNGSPLADGGNLSGSATASLMLSAVTTNDAASYSVIVSNSLGTITSAAAALVVILPPAITAQPAAQTLAGGGNASFSVTANGSAPLAYKWLKNGGAITNGTKYSGVTSNVLNVVAVTTNDVANYSVIITNLAGSVTSSIAPLTIVATPTITTPPANLSVIVGAAAGFTVSAAGSAPLFYFWLKNGSPLADGGNLSGSATASLILSAVTTNDAASYSVIVSNSLGTITSPAATLTVSVPPAIITSPASATLIAGSNVTFTVAASGTAPLVYQWKKNNIALANGGNVSGATTATLALANLSAADAANYFATVTNAVGGVASAAATLTVLVPPAIAIAPVSASIVQGNSVSFSASATGTAPLSFQWLKDGGIIAGAVSNVLTLSAVSTNDAGNYSVVVTNIVGSAASSSAALTVLVPPTIIAPPTDVAALAGSNIAFTVTASGTAPLTYQWKKNSVNLAGATLPTLNLNSVAATNAANYSVVVSNAAGSALSSAAVLTVLFPPAIVSPPANQFGAIGSPVNLSVVASGTGPLSYQWFQHGTALVDGGNVSGSTTTNLTITALTTNGVDTYSVVVSNAYGTVTSANASVTINAAPIITVPPASQNIAVSNTATFTVTASGTGPLAYRWLKNGIMLTNGTIIYGGTTPGGPQVGPLKNQTVTGATVSGATLSTLALANVSTNDNGNYSVIITNIYGRITSSVATLAVLTPPRITVQPANGVAIIGTNMVFAVTATGSGPLNFQWFKNGLPLADGGNISGSRTNILKISAPAMADAGAYSVVITNLVGSVASTGATLTILIPPVIVSQPAGQSIVVSNPVTLRVSATGTAPLRYQWRKAGVAIAGATNAAYSLATVKTTDAAAYSVVVTNLAGSVTSSNATLTVLVPPVFTVQATNRAVKIGSNTVFLATVAGTAPFSFRWFKDGQPLTDGGNISGSTSNVLTLSMLATNAAGAYSLAVSNAAGSITSSNALLLVLVPPVIVAQPASLSAVVSNAVYFSVVAAGTAPLHYQWRKGGAAIVGATNAIYTITSARTNDAGIFSVVVTNLAGSVISSNATLTVLIPPAFIKQAGNRIIGAGSNTVFNATVTGTAPFQFQWLKNGSPLTNGANISGAQSNILTITSITRKNAGAYSLAVTNLAGGIVSSNAVLTLYVPPSSGGGGGGGIDNVIISTKVGSGLNPPALKSLPTLSLAIAPATLPTGTYAAKVAPDSGSIVTLTASGMAGANYILQGSADCIHWTNLQTNSASAQGVIQFIDPDAATLPARFYRLAAP